MTSALGVRASDLALTPEKQSSMPSTLSKNLVGSKAAENRSKKTAISTKRPETLDHAIGTQGSTVEGSVSFEGNSPGKRLESYSTSPTRLLPSNERQSTSAAIARFETLAAEAGSDLDFDEVNIEGLKMCRVVEKDSGSSCAIDDESDGSEFDEILLGDDTNPAKQKLVHKERSIMQMVGVLSDRVTHLNALAMNRYNGCKFDLDESSKFRSSCPKDMDLAVVNAEGWNAPTLRRGNDRSKRGDGFNHGGEDAGGGSSDVVGFGTLRMMTLFRNAPQTDAGRKLAYRLEQHNTYESRQASIAAPKFRKTTGRNNAKRMDYYKKRFAIKQKRLYFERELQSNLDQHVTRAVTELVYRIPEDISRDVEGVPEIESSKSPRGTTLVVTGHDDGALVILSKGIARERFPIALEVNDMNPKLLLLYACTHAVFPGGPRMFEDFAASVDSQHLFVYMFWFIHCKFFQEDSQLEQTHLLRCVASCYVRVLGTESMGQHRDFFFQHYPFVIANAIIWGFHYLCPGSRHFYSSAFKSTLYLQCARILSGFEISPLSTVEIRAKLFPGETVEGFDEIEYQGKRGRGVGSVAVGVASEVFGGRRGRFSLSPGTEPGAGAEAGAGSTKGETVTVARERREDGKGRNDRDKKSGTMIQRLTRTFRPNPLSVYTEDRGTLGLKPGRLEGVKARRSRPQRTAFDASQVSPMLQEYLRQSSSTAGRRPKNVLRTVPVTPCQTGGAASHRRNLWRKFFHEYISFHESISLEHVKAKKEFERANGQAAEASRRTLRRMQADRQSIFKKGSRQVGLKSMDIMTKLQQEGASKGIDRPEHKRDQ